MRTAERKRRQGAGRMRPHWTPLIHRLPRLGGLCERFGQQVAGATERCVQATVAKMLKWQAGWPSCRRKRMKRLLTIFAISGSLLFLSACNTVDGAVKDVESVGDCADGVKGNC
ncbi:hypothetical protein [Sphingopyxis sp. LK2115]|uniref:hypothetical protein n=1 Tax=Sphingopyxis sp. LK2115 TaxID=2744558 RepID=UPI002948C33C|nr:hypothetical protein [Sphingopyxis sp. LK2115]